MTFTSTIQDYVKAVYMLQLEETPVTNGRLAAYLAISAPAVTDMVKRLHALALVDYLPREGVRLTARGEQVALEVVRHHRLLELYLVEALGMGWDEVHAEAEVLEHVLSNRLEERIVAVLGNPQFDPHGAPIPARDGSIPLRLASSLATFPRGILATIVEVDDRDPAHLRYLASLGLIPATVLMVTDQAPFDGPLTLTIGPHSHIRTIDSRLAARILVQPCDPGPT
jgi:DtxR family Mn-dependent transcriptional regulator